MASQRALTHPNQLGSLTEMRLPAPGRGCWVCMREEESLPAGVVDVRFVPVEDVGGDAEVEPDEGEHHPTGRDGGPRHSLRGILFGFTPCILLVFLCVLVCF